MAEATERRDSSKAPELPDKHLPAVPYRDLPNAVPIWKIIGASAIISATAMGSGEFVLWPLIVSQVGFVIFWAAILGFFFQYVINMEIERYALVTGETAVTGFARLWRHWGLFFILCAIVPNFWPGWATGSATTITFWTGLGGGTIVPITIIMLVSIGIALTVSPVVYQTVEKIQLGAIVLIFSFIVVAVIVATSGEAWGLWRRAPQLSSARTSRGPSGLSGRQRWRAPWHSPEPAEPTTWCRRTGSGTKRWVWGPTSPTSSPP